MCGTEGSNYFEVKEWEVFEIVFDINDKQPKIEKNEEEN